MCVDWKKKSETRETSSIENKNKPKKIKTEHILWRQDPAKCFQHKYRYLTVEHSSSLHELTFSESVDDARLPKLMVWNSWSVQYGSVWGSFPIFVLFLIKIDLDYVLDSFSSINVIAPPTHPLPQCVFPLGYFTIAFLQKEQIYTLVLIDLSFCSYIFRLVDKKVSLLWKEMQFYVILFISFCFIQSCKSCLTKMLPFYCDTLDRGLWIKLMYCDFYFVWKQSESMYWSAEAHSKNFDIGGLVGLDFFCFLDSYKY